MLSITIIFGSDVEILTIKALSFPEHPCFVVGLTTSSVDIPFRLNLTGYLLSLQALGNAAN